jgi:hypothetical protein
MDDGVLEDRRQITLDVNAGPSAMLFARQQDRPDFIGSDLVDGQGIELG